MLYQAPVFPVDAGFRGGVGMGESPMYYIPTLFSGKLLKRYYDVTVATSVTNTDYEGEIKKYGDTVIIRGTPTLTIRDYTIGMTLQNETPTATSKMLKIDQGKYWAFVTDKVEKAQTDLKNFIQLWAKDAAEQLRITMDTALLLYMALNPNASNAGATAGAKGGSYNLGTPVAPVNLNVVAIKNLLVDCASALDEQNVPEDGRFVIMSPRVAGFIMKSDVSDASFMGDDKSILRTGVIGRIARFSLIISNLLPRGDDIDEGSGDSNADVLIFGHRDATTFATQLVDTEMLPNPFGFGTLHRGLQVYGREVIKSEALGRAIVTVFPAEE